MFGKPMQQVDRARKVFWSLLLAVGVFGAFLVVVSNLYTKEITSLLLTRPILSASLLLIPTFTTWVVWRVFRRFTTLRTWLLLKTIGYSVCIGGAALFWLFDLSGGAMFIIMYSGLLLWALGVAQLFKIRRD